jgi:hypothetical protein
MRSIAATWRYAIALAVAAPAFPALSIAQPSANGDAGQVLQVSTSVYGRLTSVDRDAAEEMAGQLLEAAGVRVAWRRCDESRDCPTEHGGRPRVNLILAAVARPTCGRAALDTLHNGATVFVSLPCLSEAARKMKTLTIARAHPLMFRLEARHLLGMTIAHELGHVLGLPHAPTGLMRSHLTAGEVLSFLEGRLTFTSEQSHRMRRSAIWRACAIEALDPPGQ